MKLENTVVVLADMVELKVYSVKKAKASWQTR